MALKKLKATTYILRFYNENGEQINEEAYPMYKYSLENIFDMLKGRETTCDIYIGRFYKKRRKYITLDIAYVYENGEWVEQKEREETREDDI